MTSVSHDRAIADLAACDTEPIHTPGHIQPTGFLIACRRDTTIVTHVSANAAALSTSPQAALGANLIDVLGRDVSHALANALAASTDPRLSGRVSDLALADGLEYHASAHSHAGHSIFEFEPVPPGLKAGTPLLLVRSMFSRMQLADTIDDLCNVAARQLRSLLDFDRIMVYRFLADGAGTVVAECKVEDAQSFLGHYYPASDIPAQARRLYVENWLRYVCDVHRPAVPVLADPGFDTPLDMTYCALRSVSPIHIEYLKNMGVAASLSVSIVVGGQLWGLLACHNRTPRTVLTDTRLSAELFGQVFSLQLQTLLRADVAEMLRGARQSIDRILAELPPAAPLHDSLGTKLEDLCAVIASDGAALCFDGQLTTWGSCPPVLAIPALTEALVTAGHTSVYATHHLAALLHSAQDHAREASGVLAIPLSRKPGDFLLLFRREFIHTIDWAGDPSKPVLDGGGAPRLTPRRSFEIWREQVTGQSRVWEAHHCLTGEALRIALLEFVLKYNELVEHERATAESRQRLQTSEFKHRVKNALALIGALVAQSKGHYDDIGTFISDLEGRIRALATAHDLASRPGKLDLRRLIDIELEPFVGGREARADVEGPDVQLSDSTAAVVALVVHELATNASKHGALSRPDGRVLVRWAGDPTGGCTLSWHERGGPSPKPVGKSGFGTVVINRQIPFELGGRAHVELTAEGLEAEFWLPPEGIVWGVATSPSTETTFASGLVEAPLEGRAVLLVEDSLIVALELEQTLRRLGAADVFVYGTLDRAMIFAEFLPIDVALLDVNLQGETSYPIAEVLMQRGIPFVFATGYGPELGRPERFASVPLVGKPYSVAELVRAIEGLLSPVSRPSAE